MMPGHWLRRLSDRHHVANPTSGCHEFAVAEPLGDDSDIANGLFVFAVESNGSANEML